MATYLDTFKDSYKKLRAFRGPNYSLDQKCQQMAGYYMQWAIQGNEVGIDTSGSADAAAAKNRLTTAGGINAAQPGELVYWANNHVMRIVGHDSDGRAIGTNTSLKADTIAGTKLDTFWRLSHVDTYPATYIGRSARDGHSTKAAPYPITPWPVAPVKLSPDQRQVRSNVGLVNVRSAPKITPTNRVETFTPGQIITSPGYVHGQLVTQNSITTDLWIVTGTNGEGVANRYAWLGAFTNTGVVGLDEWHDPAPVPPVVVPDPEPEPPVVVPNPEPAPEPEPPVVTPDPEPPVVKPKPETPPPSTGPQHVGAVLSAFIAFIAMIGTAIALFLNR